MRPIRPRANGSHAAGHLGDEEGDDDDAGADRELQLDAAGDGAEPGGFGFGKPGSKPGTAYNYDEVAVRTPTDPGVNTITIS